jgi:hypothetical protein
VRVPQDIEMPLKRLFEMTAVVKVEFEIESLLKYPVRDTGHPEANLQNHGKDMNNSNIFG